MSQEDDVSIWCVDGVHPWSVAEGREVDTLARAFVGPLDAWYNPESHAMGIDYGSSRGMRDDSHDVLTVDVE